jgi:WD40 repeat protein
MSHSTSLQGTLAVTTRGQPPLVATALHQHVLGNDTANFIATLSFDGRYFCACDTDDERWYAWDVSTQTMRNHAVAHDGKGECICPMTRTTRRALSEQCPVRAHACCISAVTVSEGQLIATGDEGGKAIIWDAATGKAIHVLQHTQNDYRKISAVSFTCDQSKLVTACNDMSFCMWDVVTGAQIWMMPRAHRSSLRCVACSPTSSTTFITVGWGPNTTGDLKMWDIQTQQLIRAFTGAVFGIYSPDGQRIATVNHGVGALVFILDATNGQHFLTLRGAAATRVRCGCFSPDSKQFAVGNSNGFVSIWDWQMSIAHVRHVISLGGPGFCPTLSVTWGRNWVNDTQAATAFAMGQHPRLGSKSMVSMLDDGVNPLNPK